jgi:hypothetical protein
MEMDHAGHGTDRYTSATRGVAYGYGHGIPSPHASVAFMNMFMMEICCEECKS